MPLNEHLNPWHELRTAGTLNRTPFPLPPLTTQMMTWTVLLSDSLGTSARRVVCAWSLELTPRPMFWLQSAPMAQPSQGWSRVVGVAKHKSTHTYCLSASPDQLLLVDWARPTWWCASPVRSPRCTAQSRSRGRSCTTWPGRGRRLRGGRELSCGGQRAATAWHAWRRTHAFLTFPCSRHTPAPCSPGPALCAAGRSGR